MVQEARRYKLSVGFLDPILVTLDAIKQNEGFVLEYVTRVWLAQKEKDAILFFYNPGKYSMFVILYDCFVLSCI